MTLRHRLAPSTSIVVLLIAGIGAAGIPAARAATFTVTRFDDPAPGPCAPTDCSLREAVNAANSAPGLDEIVLPAGTFTLARPADATDDDGLDGDLDIVGEVTIKGQFGGGTVINGNGAVTGSRVFDNLGVLVNLFDLTIRGGAGDSAGILASGGARTTLDRVVVSGNAGDNFGGAVATTGVSSTTIRNSTLIGNSLSGSFGGAIYQQDSSLTIENSTISGNTVGGSFGGGLFFQNFEPGMSLTIANSTIADNTVDGSFAGGLFLQAFAPTTYGITNSTISGNGVGGSGGGVFMQGSDPGISLSITNSTISNNRAESTGGGISQSSGAITIQSSTITGNRADSDGNGTGDGGGVSQGGNTLTLRNSILAGNFDPTSEPDCDGTVTSGGHNLVGIVSAGCALAQTTGDQTGTPASPLDPKVGPLANNGGPTLTHALLKGSPAIDAAGPGSPNADQRRAPRIGPPDIGAYELVLCRGRVVNRVGTDGNDGLRGTAGKDGLLGLGGKDNLRGKAGSDGLCGGPGRDSLRGGGGKDRLDGGPSKDLCVGQAGRDKAKGCERKKSIP